jgi:hypothetical protein
MWRKSVTNDPSASQVGLAQRNPTSTRNTGSIDSHTALCTALIAPYTLIDPLRIGAFIALKNIRLPPNQALKRSLEHERLMRHEITSLHRLAS